MLMMQSCLFGWVSQARMLMLMMQSPLPGCVSERRHHDAVLSLGIRSWVSGKSLLMLMIIIMQSAPAGSEGGLLMLAIAHDSHDAVPSCWLRRRAADACDGCQQESC